jgi:hypothetical protein
MFSLGAGCLVELTNATVCFREMLTIERVLEGLNVRCAMVGRM